MPDTFGKKQVVAPILACVAHLFAHLGPPWPHSNRIFIFITVNLAKTANLDASPVLGASWLLFRPSGSPLPCLHLFFLPILVHRCTYSRAHSDPILTLIALSLAKTAKLHATATCFGLMLSCLGGLGPILASLWPYPGALWAHLGLALGPSWPFWQHLCTKFSHMG